ncbi:alcohol dehydrogenase catalytic domain-containing protein [Fodinicola feengrottensis]|uniref:alcohol dehydrogenase catalytic domain-containing protein n=1 Tax=Fodinicola feengrottensis TaxID=435914 RepID=UPI002441DFAB|nr:alcohol dehydrogenase catalytic domain-containing protein [Fodinicola feengrottensis]
MKAVVVHGVADLRIDEVPEPAHCPPGSVIVEVDYGGICGSDLHYVSHGSAGTSVLRHPLVLGHELSGRIARIADDVLDLRVGQPVTIHPGTGCGECRYCQGQLAHLCVRMRYFGSAAHDPHTDGGFVRRKVVPASQIRPLPPWVDLRSAAVVEPLSVALHAVRRAGELAGKTVLVNGTGPIGALVVAIARRLGAAQVYAVDIASAPLAIAKALGAHETIDASTVSELPEAEIAFEASGSPAGLSNVVRWLPRRATLGRWEIFRLARSPSTFPRWSVRKSAISAHSGSTGRSPMRLTFWLPAWT